MGIRQADGSLSYRVLISIQHSQDFIALPLGTDNGINLPKEHPEICLRFTV
jgi:hypothetical protein